MHALAAVLLWSTVAAAFKLSLRHLQPAQLLLVSTGVSALFLGGVLLARGQLRQLSCLPRRDWLRSAGLGLLNPCLYYLILFAAYDRLPAQQAQPLNYTWALVLAWLSALLLRERLLPWDIIAGFVCYAGVLVVATRGDVLSLQFDDTLGVALALGSTVIWALYWVGLTRDRVDPVQRLFLNFLLALPPVTVVCVLTSGLPPVTWQGLAGAVYVGLFEMGLTFVLWLGALQRAANASRVANLIFLSPFLSLVLIHYLVGEPVEPATIFGLAIIVAGLVLQKWGSRGGDGSSPRRRD
ncbi:MAG: DMT family transporter [bacterium]|nr:DMT family transporter [bacterium]